MNEMTHTPELDVDPALHELEQAAQAHDAAKLSDLITQTGELPRESRPYQALEATNYLYRIHGIVSEAEKTLTAVQEAKPAIP